MTRLWITVFVTILLVVASTGCGLAADGPAEAPSEGTKPTGPAQQPRPGASAGASESPPANDEPTSSDGVCDDVGSGSDACATLTRNDRPAPNVVGMRVLAACERLVRGGYRGGGVVVGEVGSEGIGPGRVVSQDPRPGGKGFVEGPVELVVSAPYPAQELRRNPDCGDATQYGPGGKPNEFPNGKPKRAERR